MCHQAISFQQPSIVFIQLCGKACIFNAGIGRKQLVFVSFIGQIIPDISGHISLVVQFTNCSIGFIGLSHIHTCRRLYIRQQMLTLEGRYIIIHIAEFPLNHTQTLIDEHGGTDRYLILVPYPVLIVNGYKGIEHIFRPLGGHILERQRDDIGFSSFWNIVKFAEQLADAADKDWRVT